MSSHTGRAFLNSCLKTPIDPCNNCPAPIYNRPKMYLGRLSTITPLSTTKLTTANTTSMKNTTITEITENTSETNLWASGGIRSLAKLYDSIPDYCDLNHLTEEEFYSTLDSLRSTCRELKTKPLSTSLLDENSLSSGLTSNCSTVKTKKVCKKKSGSTKKGGYKKKSKADKKAKAILLEEQTLCVDNLHHGDILDKEVFKSCRSDFQAEVEAFKQTLKDFEEELVNRSYSNRVKRAKSTNFIAESTKSKIDENTQTDLEAPSSKPGFSERSERTLRKAYSFNDINELNESDSLKPKEAQIEKPALLTKLSKAESLAFKDTKRLSNYFAEPVKTQSRATNELPKISIHSPSSENTTSTTTTERSTPKMKKEKIKEIKTPFSFFTLTTGSAKKENFETPSPVHPVARPNLAATLRAEVSRKKLKELQNNCTFYDKTPQIDWEVRKTPAWRSLALNESHKEILALRLATRKAEQALQRREYELNMELMRQRVKSAPLLLEGATFWGPNVGKLTHNCQNEGLRHTCESLQRKKKLRQRCTRDTLSEIGVDGNSAKLHELRKIYVSNGKSLSHSRNSQHSTTGRRSNKERRKEKKRLQDLNTSRPSTCLQNNDSGDELSSADRAFL